MDDSWSFRTERGRSWVADGHLRTEGSLAGALRSTYHERWKRARPAWKALYLFSFAGTATWFGRVRSALEALAGPDPVSPISWFVLAATALLSLVVVRQVGTSERIPLARVESVRRTDRTLTVEYADPDGGDRTVDLHALTDGEDRTLEIHALTDEDADEAVRILRLKGVRVERHREDATADGDADGTESGTYVSVRERLAEEDD